MSEQLEIVNRYLKLVESLELNEENAEDILHSDYLQWELPNLLNKAGQTSDAGDSYKRMQVAKSILAVQKYEVTKTMEQADVVVIEAIWTGEMALDAGSFHKGQVLKAFFCMIFEFQSGKIHRVRNYDCFEAF
jgi:ketosteroid isomerase-like protein